MTTRGGRRYRISVTFALLAAAAGTTAAVAGHGSTPARLTVVAVGLGSIVAVAFALRHPGTRLVWAAVALAQLGFVAGDVATRDYRRLFGAPLEHPWLANLPSLLGYALAVAAIGLLLRARSWGDERPALIDALVVGAPAAAAVWAYLVAPLLDRHSLPLTTKLVSVAYPILALLVAVAVAQLLFAPGPRRLVSFVFVLGAGVALVGGELLRSWLVLHPGGLSAGEVRETSRILFVVLMGAAALDPSATSLSAPHHEKALRPTALRLAALLSAACVVPALFAAGKAPASGVMPLAASLGIVFLLLCLRLLDLARRHEAVLDRSHVLAQAGAGLVEARTAREVTEVVDTAVRRLLGPSATITIGADEPAGGGLVLSLQGRRESHGNLAVHAGRPLGVEEAASVRTLADSVALALDGVKALESLLRKRMDARFQALVQHSSDAVLVLDAGGRVDYATPSTVGILGVSPDELHGRSFIELVQEYDRPRVAHALDAPQADGPVQPLEFELAMPHGVLEVEATCTNLLFTADVRGIVLNIRDVRERKEFERRLAHRAFHDELTGLANRMLFRDRVEHALERVARGSSIAVLFLDLDDFKAVNDTLGHQAGDELISTVASRLASTARSADTAARLGGDEFAVLVEDDTGDHSELIAQRLLRSIAAPIQIDGRAVTMTASIGIACARPGEVLQVDTLLRNADVAMYEAKASGKSVCRMFSPEMHAALVDRVELKRELLTAIDRGEFELRYQPVVDLATREFVSLEALIRWNHPTRGFVSPDEFIPIAEASGAIVPLGLWALRAACEQAVRLQWVAGASAPTMSVNISTRQLQEPTLVADTNKVLLETGLPPEKLVLEITETAMISDFDLVLSRLRDLRANKIRVAVDDFGSGYSSLNYIRRLPIDVLKIDREFIADIGESSEVAALTATILSLARIIGVVPVAEGIETPEQLAELTRLGCTLGQGYLFMPPVDGEEIARVIGEQVATRRADLSSRPEPMPLSQLVPGV
jgi:diguanylate cyclase (GGDEF)-like protein/PAS domain S-box-containing protein